MNSGEVTVSVQQTPNYADLKSKPLADGDTRGCAEENGCCRSTIVTKLLESLEEQSDLVIDFTSLKTCLNPMGIGDQEFDYEDFDYEDFLYDILDKQEERFPKLQKLTVTRLLKTRRPLTDNQHDYYTQLNYSIMQLSCLTELDLKNLPPALHDGLQLWNLHNLRKLAVTESNLKSLPGSIGRLKKLEELDLSVNELSKLPITLAFCKKLTTLDLHRNNFTKLPGVILHLKNLSTLRRLNNPLTQRYEYPSPDFTKKIPGTQSNKKVYQPLSLQSSCTKVIFTSQLDYWEVNTIGQLQCKILDTLAVQFINCDHCNKMIPENANNILKVQVLLVTFCELTNVPFVLHACSVPCQENIAEMYSQRNERLQNELDSRYQKTIKEAQKQMKEGKLDIETRSYAYTPPWTYRRRKRCSIM